MHGTNVKNIEICVHRGLRVFGDQKTQRNTSYVIRNSIALLAIEAAICFDPKGLPSGSFLRTHIKVDYYVKLQFHYFLDMTSENS